MMKVNNKNVYSLPDITDVMGPYGYKNNIFLGFNCRHRLIPYDPDKAPPTKYSEEDVKEQRKIEENIRRMEREIRLQKTRLLFYEKAEEKKIVKNLRSQIKILIERYKQYCERNARLQKDFEKFTLYLEGHDLLDQTRETSFESEELQEYWIEVVRSNRRFFILGAKWKF